jgi:hypothetical protein
MSCRINQVATEVGTLLRVDGHLNAESLGELEGVCKEALPPLTLNIEGVRWIDDQATAYLQQLIADGTAVTNASPFIALRLKIEREDTLPRMTNEEINDAE